MVFTFLLHSGAKADARAKVGKAKDASVFFPDRKVSGLAPTPPLPSGQAPPPPPPSAPASVPTLPPTLLCGLDPREPKLPLLPVPQFSPPPPPSISYFIEMGEHLGLGISDIA